MTIMIGQPLAHSLNSEAGFCRLYLLLFQCQHSQAHCCASAMLPREFLCDGTCIDDAQVRKIEQDSETSDQQRAALCPCCGRDLASDA
jgi:hypothetical protein